MATRIETPEAFYRGRWPTRPSPRRCGGWSEVLAAAGYPERRMSN